MGLSLVEEEGWTGIFTRDQSPLARFANGARIVKAKAERGDGTPLGTQGVVLGSMGHPDVGLVYFVEWDGQPRTAVVVVDWKLGLADGPWSN